MKTLFTFITVIFLSSQANAQSGDALTHQITGSIFRAQLTEGFHFNAQAPNMMIVDGKRVLPNPLKARDAQFAIPAQEQFSEARVSLYVCDDAVTFCEPRTIELKGKLASAQTVATETTQKKRMKMKINHHGFIEDDLEGAASQAAKEKKLLLVDFSARWCPGCVRLENEILDTKAFKRSAKPFVKVKLDYDRFENLALKSKYGIWAIPTVMVMTPELEEVSRLVDFQPMPKIATFLQDALSHPQTLTHLKSRVDGGDKKAALVLGQRLYIANRFEEAVTYLSMVEPKPIELASARVSAAKNKMSSDSSEKSKREFQAIAKAAIADEPNSSRSIVWRTALVESLPAGDQTKSTIAAEGVSVADDLLANRSKIPKAIQGDFIGEYEGYEALLIAGERADLIEASGASESAVKAAKKKIAEVGKASRIPAKKTGPALRYLIALIYAEEYPEAETQARALLKLDSANPELQRRLLRVLNGQKKFAEAIQIGNKALPKSYGKNEVWVAQQLAKAYSGNDQKLEARALIENYLNRPDVDWAALPAEKKDMSEMLSTLK